MSLRIQTSGAEETARTRRTKVGAVLDELKLCSGTKNLQRGTQVHAEALEAGLDSCIFVANSLVNMYAKCGSMVEARQVFDRIQHPDVVSWNTLILGYAENGEGAEALDVFGQMTSQGCSALSSVTFIAALKACISLAAQQDSNRSECLERGRKIHAMAGCLPSIYVQNTLIDMYAKCGSMADALQVLQSMKQPTVVSWNTLILGYAENGLGLPALNMFARMKSQGCIPNSRTFVAALKACSGLALDGSASARQWGKQIHSQVGCHMNTYVHNTLIDMYAKFGSMSDARKVFDSVKRPDVISWNALMVGYADNGEGLTVLNLFERMRRQGPAPNSVTFIAALKACTSVAVNQQATKAECLERGKLVHSKIGCHLNDAYVQNTLIDMYLTCGDMTFARRVFDGIKQPDVVAWNALLLWYAENGKSSTALDLFARMRLQGCTPNSLTYVAALKACSALAQEDGSRKTECRELGKQMHSEMGCHSDVFVSNTLIDMYAKCGSMSDARQVFDSMQHATVVSWTVLIMGYAENGEASVALGLFSRMKSQGYAPNHITIVGALRACSLLGALDSGMRIHAEVDTSMELTSMLVTCLVDFYAKCGSLEEARGVLDASHPGLRDLRTYTALLAGYTRLGDENAMFGVFDEMQHAGFQPDGVTFLCILTCCSHAGLLEKTVAFFELMSTKYGITPTLEHCNCMVDILGRCNKLNDAMALLRSMTCRPSAATWMTLLDACRKWKNVGTGRVAFESVVSLDESNAAVYVLMASTYESRGMWEKRELVVAMRTKFKAWKELGQSCWTNGDEVHAFKNA